MRDFETSIFDFEQNDHIDHMLAIGLVAAVFLLVNVVVIYWRAFL